MTWNNKIVWTEGMFLQPQHFQQHDRFLEAQLRARMSDGLAFGWGFGALVIDDGALISGKLALVSARGVLPDGTTFRLPVADPAPAELNIPPDARNELVVLAITLQQPGRPETDIEDQPPSPGPRFRVAEVEVGDSNALSTRDAPVHVGRLYLRLMLARDSGEAFATLGVARVIERRADNRVVLDPHYVPPLLHAFAHPVMHGWVRELLGLLNQRSEVLAARLAEPGRSGVGEIVDFLLLGAVNRNAPLFAHLLSLPLLHPDRLYADCLRLSGELATFRDKRRPVVFPAYAHDDLARTFAPVIDDLRQSLSMVMEQTAIPIELQERQRGVRLAIIADLQLQREASFVLAVNAQMPSETLRARFPQQVKIGPAERIRDLVNLQLPGIELRALPVAPRQIKFHAGFSYFELDTRHNEMWKQLETSGGLAMYVGGDFPGLEMEFWAIRA